MTPHDTSWMSHEVKWGGSFRWLSCLYCPMRDSGKMTNGKTHPSLFKFSQNSTISENLSKKCENHFSIVRLSVKCRGNIIQVVRLTDLNVRIKKLTRKIKNIRCQYFHVRNQCLSNLEWRFYFVDITVKDRRSASLSLDDFHFRRLIPQFLSR